MMFDSSQIFCCKMKLLSLVDQFRESQQNMWRLVPHIWPFKHTIKWESVLAFMPCKGCLRYQWIEAITVRYQAELTVSFDKTVCKLFLGFICSLKSLLYSSNLNRKNPSFLLIYNLLQHLTINSMVPGKMILLGVQTLHHMATNHNVFSIIYVFK